MKKLLPVLILLCACGLAIAQTNVVELPTVTKPSANSLLLVLIPALVPFGIALAKWALPLLPTALLPILASGLGVLLDYIGSISVVGGETNVLRGALLGAAGVGTREIFDQVKQAVKAKSPDAVGEPPKTP
jgi:hypothetical protein